MHVSGPMTSSHRRRARGRNINLALTFLTVIAAYLAWILLTPRITAYEVGGIMKVVCNDYMRQVFYAEEPKTWEGKWTSRIRSLGVPMQKQQYRYKVAEDCSTKKCSCDAEAVFELKTHWAILEDFVDMPLYVTRHRKKIHVDYRASY